MNRSRRAARPAGPSEDAHERGASPEDPVARPKPTPPTMPLRVVGFEGAKQQTGSESERRRGRGRRRRRRRSSRLPARAIVFVGPMAAGKTSLGKRVARELGIPFVDTDALIVRRHGAITDFFEQHGEAAFRSVEADTIAEELSANGTRIVALGGGAVLTERTRRLLREHPVILLMTTQEAVLRTANLSRRPLLRDDPDAWGRILEERRGWYEEVADVTFRTDRATKEQLARRVAQWVRGYARRHPEKEDQ